MWLQSLRRAIGLKIYTENARASDCLPVIEEASLHEMDTKHLTLIAQTYADHIGRGLYTVAGRVGVHGRVFKQLLEGSGCHVSTYQRAMQWFADNWPADLEWPRQVPSVMMSVAVMSDISNTPWARTMASISATRSSNGFIGCVSFCCVQKGMTGTGGRFSAVRCRKDTRSGVVGKPMRPQPFPPIPGPNPLDRDVRQMARQLLPVRRLATLNPGKENL